MNTASAWIRLKAAETLYPAQVESTLERMSESWPSDGTPLLDLVEAFPLGADSLLHLISVSRICAGRFARDPEILRWLSRPEICARPRSHNEMLQSLRRAAGESAAAQNFRALRLWKGREMVRIALRDVADVAPLEETTLDLSLLAEICLREVYRHWHTELSRLRGAPQTEFAILGLGKLGGRELNLSSDIDLIFLYDEEGQVSSSFSHHQWFNLLGSKILETFASSDPAGTLFRIDLRLRPEGTAGPLARSLASMENYYAGFGETWERLALIKARGVGGSRELAYEFLRQLQPFIYPKGQTPDLLDEIARIKRRIERDIVGHDNIERDVKLGTGGIREIEFVVQALQLLHGARHAFLQETSTLKVLPILAELELIPAAEERALESAYHFLRRVEHRLQIEAEQQTHTLPEESVALHRLVWSLGYRTMGDFNTTLREHMQKVRSIFRRVVETPANGAESSTANLQIFRDEKSATKSLADLAKGTGGSHVAARTRQVLRKLQPLLFQWLAKAADPDATLNQFVRFVEAYGLRSMLFELLVSNPKLLELLVKIFDASRFAGDLLIRRPQLLEDVTRRGVLDREMSVTEHLRRLETLPVSATSLDPLRVYRQTQLLRVMLRDVLGLAGLEAILTEHSALAEACLRFVNRLQDNETSLTIIALGKFGGSEIGYGADLDVLFVGDDIRAAQNLVVTMAQPTPEGNIGTLDARLRPDGEKGNLACALAAYEAYYATRAQLWEAQALTRARPIAGPHQDQFMNLVQQVWRIAGQREDLFAQIRGMLDRIHAERGTAADFHDFKTGTGGIIETEFLVQALQWRAGIWNPRTIGALAELANRRVLPAEEATWLKSHYEYLRRIESILRRWENKSVSVLPVDEEEQRKLARRLGAENLEAFDHRYREARESIHAIASRYLG